MLAKVAACLFALTGVRSSSNFPNYTHVKLGVVVEERFIRSEGATTEQMEEIIRSAVTVADKTLVHGEFSLEWAEYTEVAGQADYGAGIDKHKNAFCFI